MSKMGDWYDKLYVGMVDRAKPKPWPPLPHVWGLTEAEYTGAVDRAAIQRQRDR